MLVAPQQIAPRRLVLLAGSGAVSRTILQAALMLSTFLRAARVSQLSLLVRSSCLGVGGRRQVGRHLSTHTFTKKASQVACAGFVRAACLHMHDIMNSITDGMRLPWKWHDWPAFLVSHDRRVA